MITPIDEAFARLTMLEFALEVVMANHLVQFTPEASENFKVEFLSRMQSFDLSSSDSSGSFSHAHEQKEAEIARRSLELAERFFQKVADREAEIRGQKSQGG